MTHVKPEWLEHQSKRWLRHDAHRWIRPDAYRFLRPDYKRFLQAGAARISPLAILEGKANFNPNQPRMPKGNPDGGQWTNDSAWAEQSADGESSSDDESQDDATPLYDQRPIRLAQLESVLDDAGRPYYNPGGHHEASKGVYGKWNLSDEVRRIFDKATTGTIPNIVMRTSPDGVPQGHFWHGKGGPHRIYNEAVKDLSDDFFKRNNITPDKMTPNHAHELLKEIRESDDPRIRNYNNMIRMLRRFPSLRGGRGAE